MHRFWVATLSLAILASATAAASTFTEMGDAGQTLGTAQLVNTFPGGTALTAIIGTMEVGGADLYQIYLTGGQTFSATTVNNITFFDSQLFLFNAAGIGVYANDDDPNSPPQSTLPAGISFTPAASGFYYLAISGSGYLPLSSSGLIFPASGGLLVTSGTNQVAGPTGPGGASALTGWSSTSNEAGAYRIDLTGAQFLPSSGVPEPSTALLMGGGLLLAGVLRRRLVR